MTLTRDMPLNLKMHARGTNFESEYVGTKLGIDFLWLTDLPGKARTGYLKSLVTEGYAPGLSSALKVLKPESLSPHG